MIHANFSTGPVALSARVRATLAAPAISHRAPAFLQTLDETRALLKTLTHAQHVALACGGGTFANEIVAQQIKALPGRGLILVSGEFGERLCGLAQRAGLSFDRLSAPWGAAISANEVRVKISGHTRYSWLWCAAVETSTGTCVDVSALKALTKEHEIALCLDCMSAIGLMPLDLEGVRLASASSGKALAAIAGLAIVFAQERPEPCADIPASLDLGLHLRDGGVPFTMPSLLLSALCTSLRERVPDAASHFTRIANDDDVLRHELRTHNLLTVILADKTEHAGKGVITIALPKSVGSHDVGYQLRKCGVEIGFESEYLSTRNWIQVALMGHYSRASLKQLPAQIAQLAHPTIRAK
jgi:aspartate aminotransferase-like enzyme